MKIKKSILVIFAALLAGACNFNKSFNKDLVTGMTTLGDGLSVERVYLSANGGESRETTFTYGETFKLNFNDIQGFAKDGGAVYPGMELTVLGAEGDTVLHSKDLYADQQGLSLSPLVLSGTITVANPMKSTASYELYIRIWDKRGGGDFTAQMDFDIVPDEKIVVGGETLTADEIYLFDVDSKTVVTDGHIGFDKKVLLVFRNLDGFATEGNKARLGMKMKASDAQGRLIYQNADLLANQLVSEKEIKEQLAASLSVGRGALENPITWQVEIWDKDSDAKLSAELEITVN